METEFDFYRTLLSDAECKEIASLLGSDAPFGVKMRKCYDLSEFGFCFPPSFEEEYPKAFKLYVHILDMF